MSTEVADQLAKNNKKLTCMGCDCTNIPGDPQETSAPFYEIEVWNYSLTDKEGKEIYCSECLSNTLSEDPLEVYSVKQIWVSDYDLKMRRED